MIFFTIKYEKYKKKISKILLNEWFLCKIFKSPFKKFIINLNTSEYLIIKNFLFWISLI